MRWVLWAALFLVAGCGTPAEPGVDPCTGHEPPQLGQSKDPATVRTIFWLENPSLRRDSACSAGNARVAAMAAQDAPATVVPDARGLRPTSQRRTLTDEQIDRMITFATILGRASGCGFTIDGQMRNLVSWLDQNVSDPAARAAYLDTAGLAFDRAALQQRSGTTGDSCLDVSAGLTGAVLR